MEEIEGFRYRAQDALRAVTKSAVKEARLKEIKSEILNSEKLKAYFEDNPRDLQVLRHDKDLHPTRIQPHLKNVPEYLVPPTLRPSMAKSSRKRRRPFISSQKNPHTAHSKKRKMDPLKSFKYQRHQPKGSKGHGKGKRGWAAKAGPLLYVENEFPWSPSGFLLAPRGAYRSNKGQVWSKSMNSVSGEV